MILGFVMLLAAAGMQAEEPDFPKVDRMTAGIFLEADSPFESSQGVAPPARALTPLGIELLKGAEGDCRCDDPKCENPAYEPQSTANHCPYDDAADLCTIGYGHLIPARKKCADIAGLLEAEGYLDGITEEEAQALFLGDLAHAQRGVEAQMSGNLVGKAPLTDYQYDALTSFTFNNGVWAFTSSTLLKEIKARETEEGNVKVRDQFARWVYATVDGKKVRVDGLVNRRKAEIAHFFFGIDTSFPGESSDGTAPFSLWVEVPPEDGIDVTVGEVAAD